MTDLNAFNLQEVVNSTLQQTLNIRTKKTSILLWTNPKQPNSFILKDRENKRYIGLPRTDKKGATYWNFREITKKNQSSPEMEPTQEYDQSNSEQSGNS